MEQWPGISITYGGEAVSLAAAEVVLGIYRDQDVIGRLWRLAERLQTGVNEVAARQGLPFRLLGLPVCPVMQFSARPADAGDRSRPASTRQDPASRQTELFRGLYRRGIIPFPVMYESTAHTEAEIDYAVEAFGQALQEAYRP
jgi:glutamate-1-semialdehyde 2,1-aminomutase